MLVQAKVFPIDRIKLLAERRTAENYIVPLAMRLEKSGYRAAAAFFKVDKDRLLAIQNDHHLIAPRFGLNGAIDRAMRQKREFHSLLASYFPAGGYQAVEGWLSLDAGSMTIALEGLQREQGIAGHFAEIGVHHGRYFVLLASLRRNEERAFAVDIFDQQHLNPDGSGCGDLELFKASLNAYGESGHVKIIKKDSKELKPVDLDYSKIRMFSVDGSHRADYVLSDLRFAASNLAPGGIIMLDDFFNPDWPGVQEGYHAFAATDTSCLPFAVCGGKLFLCEKRIHDFYLNFCDFELRRFAAHIKGVELHGARLFNIKFHEPSNLLDENYYLAENHFLLCSASLTTRLRLIKGWATVQPNGVWTVGDEACLEAKIRPMPSKSQAWLRLTAKPFLHKNRKARRLQVELQGESLASWQMSNTTLQPFRAKLKKGALPDIVVVKFLVEDPESPAEHLGTSDRRRLGFFISELSLVNHAP